jgi:hypothetical protein
VPNGTKDKQNGAAAQAASVATGTGEVPIVGIGADDGHGSCPPLGWSHLRPPNPAVMDCRSGAWQQVFVPADPGLVPPPPVEPKDPVRVGQPWQRCGSPPIPNPCPCCCCPWLAKCCAWFRSWGHKNTCAEPAPDVIEPPVAPSIP